MARRVKFFDRTKANGKRRYLFGVIEPDALERDVFGALLAGNYHVVIDKERYYVSRLVPAHELELGRRV